MSDAAVTVCVLGRMSATVDGTQVALGAPGQRAVLARLVAAGRRVVSTDRLIDDLWAGEPPPRALSALQVHVSNLRRILEPGRKARTPATVLISAQPGYALDLPTPAVDAWQFEQLIAEASDESDQIGRAELLDRALKLWTGTPYQEVAEADWAVPEIARLDDLRHAAVEQWAAATMAAVGPGPAIAELQRLVHEQPGREEAVRLLALAQYRSGLQAEALAVLRRARRYLSDELGIDPGPALQALEKDVLAQDSGLNVPQSAPQPAHTVPPVSSVGRIRAATRTNARSTELTSLLDLANLAARGGLHLVWLGGEAGAGKTSLTQLLAARLGDDGWHTTFGRCPEVEGAPPGWPWSEVLTTLTAAIPPDDVAAQRLRPLLHDGPQSNIDAVQPFWLSRWLADYLGDVSDDAPVLVVLDDLHRADALTLQLLRQLTDNVLDRPIVVVGTYRASELTDDLMAIWATTATVASTRIDLGGMDRAGITVVAAEHGLPDADDATIDLLMSRTDGNPLFVRELSQLIASEGLAPATSSVPDRIGDVLRRRVSRLPERTVTALRTAAVIGRDADIEVLGTVAGLPELQLTDDLEPAVVAGLLTEPRSGIVRFAHVLVQDVLYSDTSRLRRTRIHASALAVLADRGDSDVAALARHATLSATPATAATATPYIVAAARNAEALTSYREARTLWEAANDTYALARTADDAGRIELAMPLTAARARTGDIVGGRAARLRTVELAVALDDRDLLVRALTSWRAPVIWTLRVDNEVDETIVSLVESQLLRTDLSARDRSLLLITLVFELEGLQEERVIACAVEALELARTVDDALLLCQALGAYGYLAYGPDLDSVRLPIATELLDVSTEAGLDEFRALAHFQLFLAGNSVLDLALAKENLGAALRLATGSQLGQLLAVGALYAGLLDLVAGRYDAALARYRMVSERMTAIGTIFGELIGVVGEVGAAVATDDYGSVADRLPTVEKVLPGNIRSVLALAQFDAGRIEDARDTWETAVPYRRDYYWRGMTTFRALAAARLGDLDVCRRCFDDLRPFSGTLAGFDSGSLYAGPVDAALAAVCEAMGDTESAARYRSSAVALNERMADELSDPDWLWS